MVYRLINPWNLGRILEEFVNHSLVARDLRILLAFYQPSVVAVSHKAWELPNFTYLIG